MLTSEGEARYLIRRELASSQQIVEGNLRVTDASARNNNRKVISARGPSYLLKQGIGTDKIATLEREATVYNLLWHSGASSGFARYLPHYYGYNTDEHLLILELLPDAATLWDRHLRLGRFPVAMATEMGRALSLLHSNYGVERSQTEGN